MPDRDDGPTLFDLPPHTPYHGEPPFVATSDTSREAAHRQKALVQKKEDRVIAFVRSRGLYGATCDEVEVALEMLHQSASARCTTLRNEGIFFTTKTTRLTRSGCPAHVYYWRTPSPR